MIVALFLLVITTCVFYTAFRVYQIYEILKNKYHETKR